MTAIDKRKEEKVLRDYEKLIYKLANKQYLRYQKKYPFEDVLQEAKISAIRAYRNYDPSKNTKLITHLYNYINFYLSHYFRSDTGLIKIPSRVLDHPSTDITFCDEKIILENLLSNLNQKEQEILKLIYLKGFTYDEVAIMYNVSRQAINNTANKCLKKLKQTATTNV